MMGDEETSHVDTRHLYLKRRAWDVVLQMNTGVNL
jgi:hypothetical protein